MEGDESDFEEAWRYFVWMEATSWRHLPKAGGLEDQDEMLMNNIFGITDFVRRMRASKSKHA
jgi:hypothetical protein